MYFLGAIFGIVVASVLQKRISSDGWALSDEAVLGYELLAVANMAYGFVLLALSL